jgi:hypothetical protein
VGDYCDGIALFAGEEEDPGWLLEHLRTIKIYNPYFAKTAN